MKNSAILPLRKSEISLWAPIRIPLDKLDVPGFKPFTLVPFNDKELLDELNTAVIAKYPDGVFKLELPQLVAHI